MGWLRAHGACEDQVRLVEQEFGATTIPVTARHRAHSRSSQVQNVGAVWPRSAQVR